MRGIKIGLEDGCKRLSCTDARTGGCMLLGPDQPSSAKSKASLLFELGPASLNFSKNNDLLFINLATVSERRNSFPNCSKP